jgi:outer membrane protein OmpA-like peptidoglycan-associated protein
MGTLLDSLTSLTTPAVGQIAERLGETNATVSRGVQTSLASVLGGFLTKARDPSSSRLIFDVLTNRPAGASLTGDVPSMVGNLTAGVPTSGIAGTLLTTLFGGRTSAVGDLITRTAGFRNPSSGSSLLGLAAPLVLDFLGKHVQDNGLSMGGVSKLLVHERDSILAAAPPGLMNLVQTSGAFPRVEAGATPTAGGRRWLWLAGIAAVALAWFVLTRGRGPAVSPSVGTLDTAASRVAGAVGAAAGEVSEAVGGLGALMKRMLPGGVELNIPSRGIESKLIAFIEDGSRMVNDTTWFDFDRLNFGTGSATILPESQEQLNNIVAVLKAYPNVNVKVGGYTDNVGDSTANLGLSQRRADAVRQALISSGIPANRLLAEGYGEKHPVADNATEEGRARNRRIALRVTKK